MLNGVEEVEQTTAAALEQAAGLRSRDSAKLQRYCWLSRIGDRKITNTQPLLLRSLLACNIMIDHYLKGQDVFAVQLQVQLPRGHL